MNNYSIKDYIHIGEGSGCGSGWVRLFVGNRGSGRVGLGRVGSGQYFAGSGPIRKVTRGQLWLYYQPYANDTNHTMYSCIFSDFFINIFKDYIIIYHHNYHHNLFWERHFLPR